ncbi:hypothetical protein CAPTEDRAFT_212300 [Capitella teleta]|uniref:Uncharacterized protein n=1 Tax=Capitella teleta TaxID=283909 RepID=R7UHK8_CAPTE|nr:hypothetical protein CAPTEDRAFT_212300 [Capitella teleta]|eukprot:ELU03298.1 hypothetical protein CAPTEDRAFT_212300 [Capitella teleta]
MAMMKMLCSRSPRKRHPHSNGPTQHKDIEESESTVSFWWDESNMELTPLGRGKASPQDDSDEDSLVSFRLDPQRICVEVHREHGEEENEEEGGKEQDAEERQVAVSCMTDSQYDNLDAQGLYRLGLTFTF